MAKKSGVEVDMLFLGLTRSPMLFGVSYKLVVTYFMGCISYYILFNDLKAFLALPICHGFMYLLSQRESLFLELFIVKQQKCNKCKNRFYHGMTNSYDLT